MLPMNARAMRDRSSRSARKISRKAADEKHVVRRPARGRRVLVVVRAAPAARRAAARRCSRSAARSRAVRTSSARRISPRCPAARSAGVDPVTGREARWEGTPLALLVSDRVAPKKGADTVIVRTAEGTAVPIPLTVIRQRRPILADRADGVPIGTRDRARGRTWSRRGSPTIRARRSWWARGSRALEIVYWQRAPRDRARRARRRARRRAARLGRVRRALRRVPPAPRARADERGPDLTAVADAPVARTLPRAHGASSGPRRERPGAALGPTRARTSGCSCARSPPREDRRRGGPSDDAAAAPPLGRRRRASQLATRSR